VRSRPQTDPSIYGDGDGEDVVVVADVSGDDAAVVGSVVGSGVGVVVVSFTSGELVGDVVGVLVGDVVGVLVGDEVGVLVGDVVDAVVGVLVGGGSLLTSVGVPVGDSVGAGVASGSIGGASPRIATISALNASSRVEISESEYVVMLFPNSVNLPQTSPSARTVPLPASPPPTARGWRSRP
jgi:hypothetical protein